MLTAETWRTLADAYAFLGNSLLAPMSQTSSVGLEPEFWEAFPTFGDAGVAQAMKACAAYARQEGVKGDAVGDATAIERASVEYTRLFVGPPRPAAAPWETFYRAEGVSVGFGQATFEMRELLREWGLELRVPNRQYEDHLGIELLLLSEMCRKVGEDFASSSAVGSFLDAHPLAWVGRLRDAVVEVVPGGYFDGLLGVVVALITWHRRQLG